MDVELDGDRNQRRMTVTARSPERWSAHEARMDVRSWVEPGTCISGMMVASPTRSAPACETAKPSSLRMCPGTVAHSSCQGLPPAGNRPGHAGRSVRSGPGGRSASTRPWSRRSRHGSRMAQHSELGGVVGPGDVGQPVAVDVGRPVGRSPLVGAVRGRRAGDEDIRQQCSRLTYRRGGRDVSYTPMVSALSTRTTPSAIDAQPTGRGDAVDPVVRVPGVHEDLLLLLEPGRRPRPTRLGRSRRRRAPASFGTGPTSAAGNA